jgi:hypothetical protein
MEQIMMSMTTPPSVSASPLSPEGSLPQTVKNPLLAYEVGYDAAVIVDPNRQPKSLLTADDKRDHHLHDALTLQGCLPDFDSISCWPQTPVGHFAQVPCPDFITGLDKTKFVSRECLSNGSWSLQGNYSLCNSSFDPVKINTPSERVLLERLIEEVSKLDESPFEDAKTTMAFEECIDNVLSKPLPPPGMSTQLNPRHFSSQIEKT